MKRAHRIFLGLLFAVVLLWASGIAPQAYNTIQNNKVSVTPGRPILNFVNGGCVDDAGNNSTDCTVGGGGGAVGGGITVFSGSSITLLGTQFVAIGGGAAISGTESTVELKAPTAAQISSLSVQLSAALGVGNSAVFTWRDAGASQALTCTISGAAATTCTDTTHSFNAAQGDELDIQIVTSGTPAAVTLVIGSVFGAVSSLNPTFTISNASSTGTTANTLTKLTGAPSTAVIAATTDTGHVVGITTAGAGTSGTATITTAGVISCVFDGATTAGDYVQISATVAGNCHDTGSATYPTSGQVIGRVLSTNGASGTYNVDLFPSEIAPSSGGGGGFIQTLTAPVAANFTALNFNTGSGVATTQTNNSSPVTSITLLQHDPNNTQNIAALAKNTIAATFTLTEAFSIASGSPNGIAGLWLSDGGSPPNNIIFGYQTGTCGMRIPLFSNYSSFSADVINCLNPFGPQLALIWLQVQETASARVYRVSSDGINFAQLFTESNTAHFTTSQYGFASEPRASSATQMETEMTLYSFKETNP